MIFGIVLGQHTEMRFSTVQFNVVSCRYAESKGIISFNNQITRYSEAVMAGDSALLDIAEQHALK